MLGSMANYLQALHVLYYMYVHIYIYIYIHMLYIYICIYYIIHISLEGGANTPPIFTWKTI